FDNQGEKIFILKYYNDDLYANNRIICFGKEGAEKWSKSLSDDYIYTDMICADNGHIWIVGYSSSDSSVILIDTLSMPYSSQSLALLILIIILIAAHISLTILYTVRKIGEIKALIRIQNKELKEIKESLKKGIEDANDIVKKVVFAKDIGEILLLIEETARLAKFVEPLKKIKKIPGGEENYELIKECNLLAENLTNVINSIKTYYDELKIRTVKVINANIRPGASVPLQALVSLLSLSPKNIETLLNQLHKDDILPGKYYKDKKCFIKSFLPAKEFLALQDWELKDRREIQLKNILKKVDYIYINEALSYLEFHSREELENWLKENKDLPIVLTEEKFIVTKKSAMEG
ncbi:MAG: hypothetical protein ACTSQJ_01540, partial [Promethearchaeota archaeon]